MVIKIKKRGNKEENTKPEATTRVSTPSLSAHFVVDHLRGLAQLALELNLDAEVQIPLRNDKQTTGDYFFIHEKLIKNNEY